MCIARFTLMVICALVLTGPARAAGTCPEIGEARHSDLNRSIAELADVIDLVQNFRQYSSSILKGSTCETRSLGDGNGFFETCPIADGWVATRLITLPISDPMVAQFARDVATMLIKIQERRDRLYGGKIDWVAVVEGVAAVADMARSGVNQQAVVSFIGAIVDATVFAVNAEAERAAVEDDYRLVQDHVAEFTDMFLRSRGKEYDGTIPFPSIVPDTHIPDQRKVVVPCPYLDAVIVSVPAMRCVAVFKRSAERLGMPSTVRGMELGWPLEYSMSCLAWRLADLNWVGGPSQGHLYWNFTVPPWPSEPAKARISADGMVADQLVLSPLP